MGKIMFPVKRSILPYNYDQASDSLKKEPDHFGKIYKTMDKYTTNGIFNIHYNYADVFNIKYTKLYSQTSEKVLKIADGLSGSNDAWKIRYDLNWEERTLDTNQITGDFSYEISNFENLFTFGVEQATAELDQPGNYKYAYQRNLGYGGIVLGEPYLDKLSANAFLSLSSKDELNAFFLKNRTITKVFSDDDYIEVGVSDSSKTRESRYSKYLMEQDKVHTEFTDDIDTIYDKNIRQNYTGVFDLSMSFKPADWYDAEVEESSYYINMFLKPTESIELLIGARQTDFKQTVYQYTNGGNALSPITKEASSLSFNGLLPSLGLKYKFNSSNHLNLAYSQTYIVPDLREFTSGEYFHPYDVALVRGNPDLVTTNIDNIDLKYSHYFSDSENLSFGLFYKYLDKPIEDAMERSTSLPVYTYDNADSATLYGFEIDGRKSFDFIHKSLKNYFVSGNFSYTQSNVTLRAAQEKKYTTNNRELQGLSPVVTNLSLGYEQIGRNVTLSYNKMGERIRKLGLIDGNDEYPDYYEVPPAVLDLVWIEGFKNGISLKLKLKNLLDEETIWYQGSKENVTNRFKVGKFYSFSVSYKY